jgi:hypothetical protein
MREQHADGDLVLVTTAESGDVVNDGIVEPDFFLVVQNHDRRGGTDDLAQRCYVVDGALGVDWSAAVAPGEFTEPLLVNRRAISADYDRSPGVSAGLDSALDHAVDGAEAVAGHADICRGLDWKAVAGAGHSQCGKDDSKQR